MQVCIGMYYSYTKYVCNIINRRINYITLYPLDRLSYSSHCLRYLLLSILSFSKFNIIWFLICSQDYFPTYKNPFYMLESYNIIIFSFLHCYVLRGFSSLLIEYSTCLPSLSMVRFICNIFLFSFFLVNYSMYFYIVSFLFSRIYIRIVSFYSGLFNLNLSINRCYIGIT